MLQFRRLELGDKALFERYTDGLTFENTELNFANLFIWRQGWKIEICEHGGVLYLSYRNPADGCFGHMQPVVPPGFSVRGAVETAMEDITSRKCGLDIMGVNDEFRDRLIAEGAEGFSVTEDRDLEEYIYNTCDLIQLQGRKYHSKRNHLNKFLADTAYTWQDLTPELLTQCLSISCEWLHEREGDSDVDTSELCAIKEAITHMRELGLVGALICVDGRPRAFTVGERYKKDMALIHLEKADPSVPGIYAFINQQFLYRHFGDTQFVNREEDMGIPGLRRAKESYYPVRMVRKYRIRKA